MNYCKVVAIISIDDYGLISDSLTHFDLPGVTVSPVQGFGDYVNEFAPNGFSDNLKIEIYTTKKQAQEVSQVLVERANAMTEGGGLVAIEPVAMLANVRKLNT